jgi:hypothetical protein
MVCMGGVEEDTLVVPASPQNSLSDEGAKADGSTVQYHRYTYSEDDFVLLNNDSVVIILLQTNNARR